jgi:hypothetical protein
MTESEMYFAHEIGKQQAVLEYLIKWVARPEGVSRRDAEELLKTLRKKREESFVGFPELLKGL